MQSKLKPVMRNRIQSMMGDVSDDQDDDEEFQQFKEKKAKQ